MTSKDAQRLHLLEAARRTWDDEAADTVLAALPPTADELATKGDLLVQGSSQRAELAQFRTDMRAEVVEFRAEVQAEMAEFRAEVQAEMAEFRAEVQAEMTEFRAEVQAEMAEFRTEIRAEITELRNDMIDRFAQYDRRLADVQRVLLIAMVSMVVSAVSLAFAAARFA